MTQDPYRSYNFNLLIEGVAAAVEETQVAVAQSIHSSIALILP